MRMLITAFGLTGTALFLQGCGGGGGGGSPTTTCHAPHLDFVAQSISGTVSGSMSGTMNQTMPSSSFSEKIDFEHFNLYSTSSSSTPITDPTTGETITVEAHTVQIINVAEKHAIMYVEASDPLSGNTTKRCMLIPLPDELPDVAALSAMLRTEVAAAECRGNDGTYDTWKMSKSYDGPIPDGILPPDLPVDLPPGLTVGGSVNVEITTSNDLLLHSAHVAMNVNVMAGEMPLYSEDISEDLVISSSEAGGPSAADLDPGQFDVECTTPDGVNVDTLASSSTPGVFQKQAVTTLQAALRPQNVAIAI